MKECSDGEVVFSGIDSAAKRRRDGTKAKGEGSMVRGCGHAWRGAAVAAAGWAC